jgi:hypothetical protein
LPFYQPEPKVTRESRLGSRFSGLGVFMCTREYSA